MAESFTFSFSSDDIEYGSDERESDMHDVGRICSVRTETPQEPGNEPRLHKLDDLVSQDMAIKLLGLMRTFDACLGVYSEVLATLV